MVRSSSVPLHSLSFLHFPVLFYELLNVPIGIFIISIFSLEKILYLILSVPFFFLVSRQEHNVPEYCFFKNYYK